MSELALLVFIFSIGLFALIRSSYYVITALSAISRYVGISEFVLAFIFLSITTSLPELTVGLNAAVSGTPEISLGDVLGTNIVNLTLILGIVTIVGKGIKLGDYQQFKSSRITTLAIITVPFVLLLDGTLTRIDGLILLCLLLIHFLVMARSRKDFSKQHTFSHKMTHAVKKRAKNIQELKKHIVQFVVSAAILVGAGYLVVFSISEAATVIGISEFMLGILVVAIGTSLPELSVGLRAARSGKESISVGNLLGAVTINMSLILGVVAIIHPIQLESVQQLLLTCLVTVGVIVYIFTILRNKKHTIRPVHGLILLLVYCLFIAGQLLMT